MRDQRTTIILVFFMMCVIILLMTVFASANLNTHTSARAFCLYEPTRDEFLLAKNADTRLPMASTTKIMTGILAIENCALTDTIEIPKEATNIEGSSIYLTAGDKLTMGDLVYSLLLQSANDAACAIAYVISGDISEFASLMNRKAEEIGLWNTHFDNPHGLDSVTHYTTAKDLARLTAYALRNEIFKQIVSTYSYSFHIGDKQRNLVNHNKLLKSCEGVIGVKTGYTDKSGRCLVSAAVRDNVTLIAVTLDDPDDWEDHKSMYKEGFSKITSVKIADLVEQSIEIPILGGSKENLVTKIDYKIDDCIPLLRGEEKLSVCYLYNKFIIAPISQGEHIGDVIIKVGSKEVARYSIIANEEIKPAKNKISIFI